MISVTSSTNAKVRALAKLSAQRVDAVEREAHGVAH